ncbi:RidA family protein [Sediminicoccus sp. KRV36]|uniref:RidA family protein n=1 Tax=Sediminicoccus sp. KRV36 TaxID=3133721 RepID=UPI00200C9B67|nr:RidA family protein [Sediminicoccus rosea]UPY36281.1 RidA family protein [Sediminicoccus rosea]
MATNEERLAALGVTLPPPFKDEANRVRALRSGQHIYMSGHGPLGPGNVPMMVGKLGRELSIPQGREAARLAGLCTLSTLRTYLGDLNSITRVVRVVGFINCAPGFNTPSDVLHGFSDLMVDVFGEGGRHTRSAIGVAELYADIPIEVEALFEVAS